MISNKQRIIGIDYGSKRIGVAMTDESGVFALPYSVVQNSKNIAEDILKICKENNVSKIIIGESKDFSQKDNPIMEEIKKFVEGLREKSELEIIFHPEFLTSAQAEHPIASRREQSPRLNHDKKNDMLDASAAAIILQSFIDKHTNMRMYESTNSYE